MISATNRTDAKNISLSYATYDEMSAIAALGAFLGARDICEHCGTDSNLDSCPDECEVLRQAEDDGGPEEVV